MGTIFNSVAARRYNHIETMYKSHGARGGDQLFPNLNPTKMNEFLNSLQEGGLTAKVFRTYNEYQQQTTQPQFTQQVSDWIGVIGVGAVGRLSVAPVCALSAFVIS